MAESGNAPFTDKAYNTGYMCENFAKIYNITTIKANDNILVIEPIDIKLD